MPTYCYRAKDGEALELFVHGHKPKASIFRNGKRYRRDFHAEWSRTPRRVVDAEIGNFSVAMGCPPQQLPEMREFMAKRGVDYRTDDWGRAVIDNRQHKRAMMRAMSTPERKFVNYDE